MEIQERTETYIQVSKEVAKKLNDLKIVPRESYEDVLRRLLDMPKRLIKDRNDRKFHTQKRDENG